MKRPGFIRQRKRKPVSSLPLIPGEFGRPSYSGDQDSGGGENSVIFVDPPFGNLNDYIAYYKADTGAGTDHLGVNSLTPSSVTNPAGIIGNGWQWTGGGGGMTLTRTPTTGLDMSGSFTIRFWFNDGGAGASNLPIFSKLSGSARGWVCKTPGSLPIDKLVFGISNGVALQTVQMSTSVISGVWNRVICFYNAPSLQIGIILNNGSADVAAVSGYAPSIATDALSVGNITISTYRFDEFGIWSRRWNAYETNQDWNSGAGLTPTFP